MILSMLQQVYNIHEALTVWELFRAWLNTEPVPGYRVDSAWANAIMLCTALAFIFLLEILITIGLQVWERRLMARMQSRLGPHTYGSILPSTFKKIVWPVAILLAIPALLYGLEYWSAFESSEMRVVNIVWAVISTLLVGPLFALALVNPKKYHLRNVNPAYGVFAFVVALGGLAFGLVVSLEPIIFPGRILHFITVVCTALAFIIYMTYMLGWYWRQGLFDAVKIFFKEDVVPLGADRLLYLLAPVLVYLPALLSWIVIPFGVGIVGGQYVYFIVQDLNIGLLLIIADFALFLVAIIMSGYASNNKYALVGAMREAAMLLTYEVPMLMSLLCVALFAGTLSLTEIVQSQTMTWAILPLFPAFVIYFVVSLAETNRPPFDLPEAQNELLGGYLVEYSGIRFALFYIAEYSNVFIVSAIMAVCFLGGWKGPMFLGPDGLWLSSLFWFLLKTYTFVYFFIWARATMPRIRIDQIMFFSWKFLLPASVVSLGLTAVGVTYRHPWFSANRFATPELNMEFVQVIMTYPLLTTMEALNQMELYERAFFWIYNFVLLLLGVFIAVMAWRILFARSTHPKPRRETTWGENTRRVSATTESPALATSGITHMASSGKVPPPPGSTTDDEVDG